MIPIKASAFTFPSLEPSYEWYQGLRYFVQYDPSNPASTWKVTWEKQGLHIVVNDAKVSKLKSTNKKVCTAEVNGPETFRVIDILVDGVGKSTVSFTLTHEGDSKEYKFKVEVRPWENPFKTLKVGSKNYTKKFNEHSHFDAKANIKGKMALKLKKGYEFQYIEHINIKNEVLKRYTKSNPKVNVKLKNMERLTIALYNKKYNENMYFTLAAIKPVSVEVKE